jgi:hypothetical protein
MVIAKDKYYLCDKYGKALRGYESYASVKSAPSQAARRLSKHLLKNANSATVYVRRKKKHTKSFYADGTTPRLYAFKATKTMTPVSDTMIKLAEERGYQNKWKQGDTYEKITVESHNLKKQDILNNLKSLASEESS